MTSHSTAHNKTDPRNAKWSLTQAAFDKLLSCFSPDRDEAGVQYECIRVKLVRFFEWNSVELAEDYVDETINRVTRRIDEGQTVDNIERYLYGVARMVLKEIFKERTKAPVALDDAPESLKVQTPEQHEPDPHMLCFDECFEALAPESRQLIIDYYQEERRAKIDLRQQLADRLHIPLNALRIRAHRIRMSLEACIRSCFEAKTNAE